MPERREFPLPIRLFIGSEIMVNSIILVLQCQENSTANAGRAQPLLEYQGSSVRNIPEVTNRNSDAKEISHQNSVCGDEVHFDAPPCQM